MGVTQLARKSRVNKTRSRQRKQLLKLLTAQPVIKNVDVEAIKLEFASKKAAAATPVAKMKVTDTPATSAE
ncbi:MAG: hypothetical protein H7329_19285 [Opitutaceae bacterium]|nr:hypothetical protein [Cytophagales bacterium]